MLTQHFEHLVTFGPFPAGMSNREYPRHQMSCFQNRYFIRQPPLPILVRTYHTFMIWKFC